jgi:dihydroneopterin aldolase
MAENESTISVFVRNMRVAVRIGLLGSEKTAPQNLDVSVELFAAPDYLQKATQSEIIDYSKLYHYIESWEGRPHTELLETLAQDLLAFSFTFPLVTAVKIELSKPEIFDKTQQAGLTAYLRKAEYQKQYDL